MNKYRQLPLGVLEIDEEQYAAGFRDGLRLAFAFSWALANEDYWLGYEAGLDAREEISGDATVTE